MPTESSLKHLAKRLFAAYALELRRKPADSSSPRASTSGALHQLSSLGSQPATVIDVGVATQTLELYESFLSVRFLLSEPLAEFEPFLQKICSAFNAQYVLAAGSAESSRPAAFSSFASAKSGPTASSSISSSGATSKSATTTTIGVLWVVLQPVLNAEVREFTQHAPEFIGS